mgnify:CR=1 FL=1
MAVNPLKVLVELQAKKGAVISGSAGEGLQVQHDAAIGGDLSVAGASNDTVAESVVVPAVITAETFSGAEGAATAVVEVEAKEADDSPLLLTALTVYV